MGSFVRQNILLCTAAYRLKALNCVNDIAPVPQNFNDFHPLIKHFGRLLTRQIQKLKSGKSTKFKSGSNTEIQRTLTSDSATIERTTSSFAVTGGASLYKYYALLGAGRGRPRGTKRRYESFWVSCSRKLNVLGVLKTAVHACTEVWYNIFIGAKFEQQNL